MIHLGDLFVYPAHAKALLVPAIKPGCSHHNQPTTNTPPSLVSIAQPFLLHHHLTDTMRCTFALTALLSALATVQASYLMRRQFPSACAHS